MDQTHPRARALLIFVIAGLLVIAMYFIFIASNEADNGSPFGGGADSTSVLMATNVASDTPAATLSVEQTPTP